MKMKRRVDRVLRHFYGFGGKKGATFHQLLEWRRRS